MISIREARLADTATLVRLEREFDRDERHLTLEENPTLKPFLRTSNTRFSTARLHDWIRSRDALVLIAQADSVPCGFSVTWIATSTGVCRPKRYGFIALMFMQRKHRGRTVRSFMRNEIFSWFTKRRIKNVCLTVMSDAKHARRIYEKWGFGDFSTVMWKTG